MMNRKNSRIIIIIGALILIMGAMVFLLQGNAPDASSLVEQACTQDDADCRIFPIVTGANLNDVALTLPEDFAGEFNLVVVTFEQDQQVAAADWYPFLNDLAQADDRLNLYNIAALPDLNPMIRSMITGGLNATVTDEIVRNVLILLFLEDQQAFLDALEISDTSQIILLLLDADGHVLWQGAGEYSDELAADLQTQIDQFLD